MLPQDTRRGTPKEVALFLSFPGALIEGAITLKTKPTFRDQRPGIRVLLDHCHLKENHTQRQRGSYSGTISDHGAAAEAAIFWQELLLNKEAEGEHRTG